MARASAAIRLAATGEFKDVADHVVDAPDLFADAFLGLRAFFRRGAGHAGDFGGKADDGQRRFQVVDDGAGEIADDGEALGLHDFAEVELVEFAEAAADFVQDIERERRASAGAARAFLRAE